MHILSGILTLQVGGFKLGKPPQRTKVEINTIQWIQPEIHDLLFRQYCCVLSYGSTVYGSNLVSQRSKAFMKFEGPYKFKNLPPEFKIDVKFYSVVLDGYFAKRTRKFKLPMMKLRAYAEINAECLELNCGIFVQSTDKALPKKFRIEGRIETNPGRTFVE